VSAENQEIDLEREPPQLPGFTHFLAWFPANPLNGLQIALIAAVLIYFYGFLKLFSGNRDSTLSWWWSNWQAPSEYEHGKLVAILCFVLVWRLRLRLLEATKAFSWLGVPVLAFGIALFLLSTRMVQARFAVASLPIVILGIVLIVCGNRTARLLLFPLFFSYLVIPIPSLEQATFQLQFVISNVATAFLQVFGVATATIGTTLKASGDDFFFEIAGGCSGVRSLMAMAMLTAIYVYLTQDRLWKQLLIFACSLVFATVGNIGRVVTIVLIARFYDREFAAGLYHDYSAFIFFPIALGAMVLFSNLVNLNYGTWFRSMTKNAAS